MSEKLSAFMVHSKPSDKELLNTDTFLNLWLESQNSSTLGALK